MLINSSKTQFSLFEAVFYGDRKNAAHLIAAGADVNVICGDDFTIRNRQTL